MKNKIIELKTFSIDYKYNGVEYSCSISAINKSEAINNFKNNYHSSCVIIKITEE